MLPVAAMYLLNPSRETPAGADATPPGEIDKPQESDAQASSRYIPDKAQLQALLEERASKARVSPHNRLSQGIHSPRFFRGQQFDLLLLMQFYFGWGPADRVDVLEIRPDPHTGTYLVDVRLRQPPLPARSLTLKIGPRSAGWSPTKPPTDDWEIRDAIDQVTKISASALLASRYSAILREQVTREGFLPIDKAAYFLVRSAQDSADLLDGAPEKDLPSLWLLYRQAILTESLFAQARYDEAWQEAQQLRRLRPDGALWKLPASQILYQKGQPQRALTLALEVRQATPLPVLRNERLIAYVAEGTGRKGLALQAWQRAAEADPDNVEALVSLARALPPARVDEAARRLEDVLSPEQVFVQVVPQLRNSGHWQALGAMAGRYCRLVPEDATGCLAMGEALLRQGKPDEAIAPLQKALDAPYFEYRHACFEYLLEAMVQTGHDYLEAFALLPEEHRADALDPLAIRFRDQGNDQGLEQLVEAYENLYGANLDSDYWRAEILRMRGRFSQADAVCILLASRADFNGVFQEDVRHLRTRIWLEWDKPIEGYKKIQPREKTFYQIAESLSQEARLEELEALIQAHGQQAGEDPNLNLFRAELSYQNGRHDRALAQARSYFEDLDPEMMPERKSYDVAVRSLLHLLRYEEALELARQWQRFSGDAQFEALVWAASGQAEPAFSAMKRMEQAGSSPQPFYYDEDIGQLLRNHPAFQSVREVWPVPDLEDNEPEGGSGPSEL